MFITKIILLYILYNHFLLHIISTPYRIDTMTFSLSMYRQCHTNLQISYIFLLNILQRQLRHFSFGGAKGEGVV